MKVWPKAEVLVGTLVVPKVVYSVAEKALSKAVKKGFWMEYVKV